MISTDEYFNMPIVNSAEMLPEYVLPSSPVTVSDGKNQNFDNDENVEF